MKSLSSRAFFMESRRTNFRSLKELVLFFNQLETGLYLLVFQSVCKYRFLTKLYFKKSTGFVRMRTNNKTIKKKSLIFKSLLKNVIFLRLNII